MPGLTLYHISLPHSRVSYRLVLVRSNPLTSKAGLPAQGIDPSTGQPVGAYIGRIFDTSASGPTYRRDRPGEVAQTVTSNI